MTKEERDFMDAVIREKYPNGGYRACLPELAHLTHHQVHNRAHKIGVRVREEFLKAAQRPIPEPHWQDVDARAMAAHREAEELLRAWR